MTTPPPDSAPLDVAGLPSVWPTILTPALRHILGLMCFQLGAPAHVYQKIGEFKDSDGNDLSKRAEDEQAFMLHKLLGYWFEHGEIFWQKAALADLKRARAALAALTPEGTPS